MSVELWTHSSRCFIDLRVSRSTCKLVLVAEIGISCLRRSWVVQRVLRNWLFWSGGLISYLVVILIGDCVSSTSYGSRTREVLGDL